MSQDSEPALAEIDLRRIGGWLLAATVALIVYASLFPFRFAAGGQPLASFMSELAFEQPTRGDLVANVLLYAPLGLCVALVAAGPRHRSGAIGAALGAGLALSFCLEALQTVSVSRVASLTDVVLNGTGALLGGVIGSVCVQRARTLRWRGLAASQAALAAFAVSVLWLADRFAPFVPTIDWQKYKDALKPLLLAPRFEALDTLILAVGWLVAAHALRLLSPQRALGAWLAAAACVLAGQIVIVNQTLTLTEIVAVAAVLPAAALLGRLGTRAVDTALAAAAVGIVVLRGLEPFAFTAESQAFGWIPFQASIMGGLELGYRVILDKSFWYLSMVWLLTRAGLRLALAALACAALLATLEGVQLFLPGRTPEITDPVLVLLLAWLVHVADQPARARAAHSRNFPRTVS